MHFLRQHNSHKHVSFCFSRLAFHFAHDVAKYNNPRSPASRTLTSTSVRVKWNAIRRTSYQSHRFQPAQHRQWSLCVQLHHWRLVCFGGKFFLAQLIRKLQWPNGSFPDIDFSNVDTHVPQIFGTSFSLAGFDQFSTAPLKKRPAALLVLNFRACT